MVARTQVQRTELKIELFTRLVARGVAVTKACEDAGISHKTAMRWLRLGQAGDPRFVNFFHRFMGAQSELVQTASMTLLDVMLNSGNDAARVNAAKYVMDRAAGWALPEPKEDDADVIDAEPVDGALSPKAVAAMSPEQLVAAIREVGRTDHKSDPDGLWDPDDDEE